MQIYKWRMSRFQLARPCSGPVNLGENVTSAEGLSWGERHCCARRFVRRRDGSTAPVWAWEHLSVHCHFPVGGTIPGEMWQHKDAWGAASWPWAQRGMAMAQHSNSTAHTASCQANTWMCLRRWRGAVVTVNKGHLSLFCVLYEYFSRGVFFFLIYF